MGRRKIEIKAIADDRNRSVTFLKRKGGLFKKAHELSVLCSVDVAVFIFGNNKKLYEYSSKDMGQLITRYQYHGGPNEHKGPSDYNSGQNNDEDDEDGDGTPPRGADGMEAHMMPAHYQGQPPQPFPQLRHQTASASPPVPNGVPFPGHPHLQRSLTPQPAGPSRPNSRGDMRRMGHGMMPQPVGPHGPHGPHPGITYMPTPPIYNPAASNQSTLMPPQPGPYPYQPPPQPYMEERRPSAPPAFSAHPPPQPLAVGPRTENPSPQPPHQLLPPQSMPPHTSPQPARRHLDPQPPPPVEPRAEAPEKPKAPLINTDTAIKKMSQRKSHSIFTPIEENRSILSQHLASFASEPQSIKNETGAMAAANPNRSQSADNGPAAAVRNGEPTPHLQQRSNLRNTSVSSLPDTPSQVSSLKINTAVGGTRPKPPRLTVQIPDGGSEAGSATGDSNSPRIPTDAASNAPHRHNSVVLPPPSPSATTLLSAGATGPPNPFARPVPQQNVNGDTPVSALPSRFLNNELLPSPSSFYPEWNFRGSDNNTLPSPLNFATPVVGTGPSFLRDDSHLLSSSGNAGSSAASGNPGSAQPSGIAKRKSPDLEGPGQDENQETAGDPKRLKVER
ncbi:hypothetical protein MKX07_002218 [Trichoderma sp. CBMAI-0711]|uniref:MADS-box MEF2 type transcription factor MIG1 n=1 Tax=Trichoderma parareesei TaxID=858221 RepID=A0A2H2ZHA3_TRIPA|nr:hypothetical protein MKX07_002218 [Trichoderma sp. CBMAI-0711]OTA06797.1 MADS-box [Trichoderma parareesei]